MNHTKKWYDNKLLVHILLVVIFPLGLFALWKTDVIAKWWKITATVLVGLILVVGFADDKTPNNSNFEQAPRERIADTPENDKAKTEGITVSQRNALRKAKEYLRVMPFSLKGLIQQLEFDQFSNADATYGADNCGADWNEQAARKAKTYLDVMSFSRGGLIDQLKFDGFTNEQAKHGVNSVGL